MKRIWKGCLAILLSTALFASDTVYAEDGYEEHIHDLVYSYVSEDSHRVICASCDLESVLEDCAYDDNGSCIRCGHRKEEADAGITELPDTEALEDSTEEHGDSFHVNFHIAENDPICREYYYGESLRAPGVLPYVDKFGIHTFKRWEPELCETVGGDQDYVAEYELTEENKAVYNYVWKDYDGEILKETSGYLDTVDITVPEVPERPEDTEYQYQFKEWLPCDTLESAYEKWKEEGADISRQITVENIATYLAYEKEEMMYTVLFRDYDGSMIREDSICFGAPLSCPQDPARESDNEYAYVFRGWVPEPEAVCTKSVVYTAVYERTALPKSYTVTFLDWNGRILSQKSYENGMRILLPDEPVRKEDDRFSYSFDGWKPCVNETCVKDMVYTAKYLKTSKAENCPYTVTFLDYDGSVISSEEYMNGEEVSIPGSPARSSEGFFSYKFRKWVPEVSQKAVQDTVYTATYTRLLTLDNKEGAENESVNVEIAEDPTEQISGDGIIIRFLNGYGSVISEKEYTRGDVVEVPKDPSRKPDAQYSYEFRNWAPAVSETAEKSVDYMPQFIKKKKK
ncbi:MAG: hypothetical protein K6G83_12955 [Lachnospiraceae bacterium]|nr:hypothetical protein [Lachnospiraceae bacterium]